MTHHLPSTIKPLLGKSLKSFEVKDPAVVQFEDGTEVVIHIVGECCSSSCIYDVIAEGSPGGPLLDVIEHDTESPQPDAVETAKKVFGSEGDCLSQWDIRFKFAQGSVLVRHLNDSNGYYDGCTGYEIRNP